MSSKFIYQAKSAKIKKSNDFKEEQHKLRTYITKCDLYQEFNVLQYNFDKKKYYEHQHILETTHSIDSIYI